MAPTLLTVGHGVLSQHDLAKLLGHAGIALVVDVRTQPHSRRNPHVDRRRLAEWLPPAHIAYRWEPDLGGLRQTHRDSPHVALHDEAFRGYADHMGTAPFWEALDRVLAEAATRRTAVLCAEGDWRRCHRSLLADAAVLARDAAVLHLAHDGRLTPHAVTAGARLDGPDQLRYDVGHTQGIPGLSV